MEYCASEITRLLGSKREESERPAVAGNRTTVPRLAQLLSYYAMQALLVKPSYYTDSVVYTHEQCVRQCLISIRTVLCIHMSSVCGNAWYRYRQCYYRADSAKVWLSSVEKPDPPTKLNLAHKREDWVKNPKSTGAGALSQTVIHFNYMLISLLYPNRG